MTFNFKRSFLLSSILVGSLSLTACSGGDSAKADDIINDMKDLTENVDTGTVDQPDTDTKPVAVTTYEFASSFDSDVSSVSYSGQVARHALIKAFFNYIGGDFITAINNGDITNKEDAKTALLAYYQDYDAVKDLPLNFSATPALTQTSLNDISSSDKKLSSKVAGNDEKGQHKPWNDGLSFVGFTDMGSFENTPEGLLLKFIDELASNVEAYRDGIHQTEDGTQLPIYVTSTGLDLQQLIQKFLLGAVTYSQGTDDYLGLEVEGKGLLTNNTDQVEGKPYTNLEHQFDEGFGYFGAARDYLAYTDDEISGKGGRDGWKDGYYDTDKDGSINLNSEYNFGHSVNAAKRDRGVDADVSDLTADAMSAFISGRALISANVGSELTTEQMDELLVYRDSAVLAWEKAIVATVIHYINDSSADLATLGTEEFDFATAAKHWSELKGFALSLQFNSYKTLSDAQFVELNSLIADQPALTAEAKDAYLADLLAARNLLQEAYGFDTATVENW